MCLSLFLSLSFYLSLCLSVSQSVSQSLCLPLSLYVSLCMSVTLCVCISLLSDCGSALHLYLLHYLDRSACLFLSTSFPLSSPSPSTDSSIPHCIMRCWCNTIPSQSISRHLHSLSHSYSSMFHSPQARTRSVAVQSLDESQAYLPLPGTV